MLPLPLPMREPRENNLFRFLSSFARNDGERNAPTSRSVHIHGAGVNARFLRAFRWLWCDRASPSPLAAPRRGERSGAFSPPFGQKTTEALQTGRYTTDRERHGFTAVPSLILPLLSLHVRIDRVKTGHVSDCDRRAKKSRKATSLSPTFVLQDNRNASRLRRPSSTINAPIRKEGEPRCGRSTVEGSDSCRPLFSSAPWTR